MSASGKAAQIFDALMAKVATINTGSPTLPVAYPERGFKPEASAPDGKYLAVSYFPNSPAWQGVTAGKIDQGLLQIAVVWPRGRGLVAPLQVAQTVMTHFAKGVQLVSGTTRVTINAEPWAAQPIIEDRQVSVPVTISWAA